MIVYLDASALVKLYLVERGSKETAELVGSSELVGTCLISRAEVAAALAKAVRTGLLAADGARKARVAFANDWADIAKVPVSEALVSRAEGLAWNHVLRGYDAVHLASALTWQDSAGTAVVVATFDRQLWREAWRADLKLWPDSLDD